METQDPRGGTSLDPCGPPGFREEDFFLKFFSHYKSLGAIGCHGNQSSNPISTNPYRAFTLSDYALHEIRSKLAN